MKYTNRKGRIRLYDGAGTPYYKEIRFDNGDFSGPLGVPKTDETIMLDRGNSSSDMHYFEGDDYKIMEPIDITFTTVLEDTTITTDLINWLKAMNDGLVTQVNSITLTQVAQSQRDGANNNPYFADTSKKRCNVEIRFDGDTDIVFHYNEVWFPLNEQTIRESDNDVALSLVGHVYGSIVVDAAFTSGTPIRA